MWFRPRGLTLWMNSGRQGQQNITDAVSCNMACWLSAVHEHDECLGGSPFRNQWTSARKHYCCNRSVSLWHTHPQVNHTSLSTRCEYIISIQISPAGILLIWCPALFYLSFKKTHPALQPSWSMSRRKTKKRRITRRKRRWKRIVASRTTIALLWPQVPRSVPYAPLVLTWAT